jgi:hypothetical protein
MALTQPGLKVLPRVSLYIGNKPLSVGEPPLIFFNTKEPLSFSTTDFLIVVYFNIITPCICIGNLVNGELTPSSFT